MPANGSLQVTYLSKLSPFRSDFAFLGIIINFILDEETYILIVRCPGLGVLQFVRILYNQKIYLEYLPVIEE